jgi:hypothetical protein
MKRSHGLVLLSLRHLPIGRSARSSGRDLRFNDAMDQTLCPFHESQMVGEATLKQHTDTMVAGNIGCRHQGDVFRRAHMAQVIGLFQYEKALRFRGLDLRKLPAEVLHRYIVERSGDAHRLFADHFESLVQLL